jgi:hypothetical protein
METSMAEINIAQIKSILTAAKKARGLDSGLVPPGRQELGVGAFGKILKQDKAHAHRKPTADAVKQHAWMKKNVVKNMRALAGARREATASARAVSPLDQPVTEIVQPFYIWPWPAGIVTQSNLAVDDNWARVQFETRDDYGGYYVSFLYLWTNPNDFPVSIDVDTSLAYIGYCSVRAGGGWPAVIRFSNAHILAFMDIYAMEDQDGTFGPATLRTPIVRVLDLKTRSSWFGASFNSAPVDSIFDVSYSQIGVSSGATLVFELYASFTFTNRDGIANFDFGSEHFQISNPGLMITSYPWIIF